MGLLNDVRRINGTAPIAPPSPTAESAPPAVDDRPRAATDRFQRTAPLPPPPPAAMPAEKPSLVRRLMAWAERLWQGLTGGGQPANRGAGVGGTSRKMLEIAAEIQEAKHVAQAQQKFNQNDAAETMAARTARAQHAAVPVRPEHESRIASLSAAQRQAFRELSESDRASFVGILESFAGALDDKVMEGTRAGLARLLEEGVLLRKAPTGRASDVPPTILQLLASRAQAPTLAAGLRERGLTPAGQLANLINHVAYPDKVYQGEGTNTCVVASLQTLMAQQDPAEYLRLATGLIWEGKVRLANDDLLELAPVDWQGETVGRSSTDAVIQEALMAHAERYDDGSDEGIGGGSYGGGRRGGGVYGGGRRGGGRYGGGRRGEGIYEPEGTASASTRQAASVPGGLTELQAEKLYEAVAGDRAVPVPVTDRNRDRAWEGIRKALDEGYPVPASVTGNQNGQQVLHQVTILELRKDASGAEIAIVADSGSGESLTVPFDQLRKDVDTAIVPSRFANMTGWNLVMSEARPEDAESGQRGSGRYGKGRGRGG
ncbi:MAG: hypothetical protein VKO64_10175 [Candidatus Sericytochromatia bacterium]|nr:hypothetical protein [Candidatus Sericytochromatia bacterium]